ncbi:MAG: hypothetical protein Kapaf2KO_05790 [Candidatus Kapaibacteriales bacterium]
MDFKNFSFSGRTALIRVDFNVPLDGNVITDPKRIESALLTINKIVEDGGKAVLISHLGRPKGKHDPEYSLKPVFDWLQNNCEFESYFSSESIGDIPKKIIENAPSGSVILLENIRFHEGEEQNSIELAEKLAELGDCYVNDAFGTAHRAHASTYQLPKLFSDRFAGLLMEKELKFLGDSLSNPKSPYTAIIGGAKISGKIDVIENLIGKADNILIGGGMMFTFLKAKGYNIGSTLVEDEKLELAKSLLIKAEKSNTNLVLPTDTLAATEFNNDADTMIFETDKIEDGYMGLDIGAQTISLFSEIISKSKSVVWNGPMGVFEMDNFAKGTKAVANALKEATQNGAVTVVGGGDSAAAIAKFGFEDSVSHVSTGGGASLEFLEGKTLPGVEALIK